MQGIDSNMNIRKRVEGEGKEEERVRGKGIEKRYAYGYEYGYEYGWEDGWEDGKRAPLQGKGEV